MASPYDVELFDEIQEELFDELLEFYVELIDESMGPDGETFGDVPMSPGSRIEDFLMDAREGALDALRVVNPKHLDSRVRQFIKDMESRERRGERRQPPPVPREAGY